MDGNPRLREAEVSRRPVFSLVPKPPRQTAGRVVGKMISQKQMKNSTVYGVLKAAWAAYGDVKMTDLEEGVMAFDFVREIDRDMVLDMSPWAIHGNCLNLKICKANQNASEVDFGFIHMWVQLHGLSLDMLNSENATQLADAIGTWNQLASEEEMQQRGYIRFRTEVRSDKPLVPGFWWVNAEGKEKWAHLKYERLSDFCYGCGLLGHSSQSCNQDIIESEENPGKPMYGPWITCTRQRNNSSRYRLGGGAPSSNQIRDPSRKSWKDMMREGVQTTLSKEKRPAATTRKSLSRML